VPLVNVSNSVASIFVPFVGMYLEVYKYEVNITIIYVNKSTHSSLYGSAFMILEPVLSINYFINILIFVIFVLIDTLFIFHMDLTLSERKILVLHVVVNFLQMDIT
jgi:hypothetical protein